MIISFVICDHCDTLLRGSAYEVYRIGKDGADRVICDPCQRQPFRIAGPSARAIAIQTTVHLALRGVP